MSPDPAAEARLFAKLAVQGVLTHEQVKTLFLKAAAAETAGAPVPLSSLVLRAGWIDKARLVRLMHADGEDVPPIPGHAYVRKLGQGATASVFEVRTTDEHHQAAKILHTHVAADPAAVRAFVAEARLLKRLSHENVVAGHKVGRIAGRYLFLMELVPGRTLQEAIAEGGAFDEDGALFVILQVARALDYLREQGVVHRDVKPGNIMVTPDNEVKLIDLGFAVAPGAGAAALGDEAADADDDLASGLGSSRSTSGTAAYLSPEQARGQDDLDVRSDIYSLGATLYQMVLGELPFAGDEQELVQQAVLAGLSAQATKGGRISAHMHYFIEKMMAKDREVRYQDPHQLMADIENQIRGKKTLDIEPEDGDDEARRTRKRLDRMRRNRKRRR